MSVEFPILSGASTQTYDGLWQPHWGVELSTYATSGKIAILVRDDYDCVMKCTTSSGTYTATVYDSTGSTATTGIASNTNFTFVASSYSNPFPDVGTQNGHGTYVIVLSPDSANLASFSKVSGNAFLWIYANAIATTTITISTDYKLELADIITGTLSSSSFGNCYSLKTVNLNSNTITNASSTFNGARALINLDTFDKSLSSYSSTFVNAFCFRNSNGAVSGTYPNATSFVAFNTEAYALEQLTLAAPVCTSFGQMRYLYSCKIFSITQSNLRDGSGTVLDLYHSTGIPSTQRTSLAESIGYWELLQWLIENEATIQATYPAFEADDYIGMTSAAIRSDLDSNFPLVVYSGILTGKTFAYIKEYDAGIVVTPLTAIGATVT